MRLFLACALLGLLLSSTARAQPAMDPDAEVARRDYQKGVAAYDHGDYEQALSAFRAAQQIHPSPDFDYNIARCLDWLGRWSEAADAYERFVSSQPNAPDAATLRERIGILRARAANPASPTPAASPPAPPHPAALPAQALALAPVPEERSSQGRLRVAAWIVGAGAVALAATGAGVYYSAWPDYTARRSSCQGQCSPESLTQLSDRVHGAEIGAGVLYGLAGAAAVTDVVLWVLSARSPQGARASLELLSGKVRF